MTRHDIIEGENCQLCRFLLVLVLIVMSIVLVTVLNRGSVGSQIMGMETADGCATIFVRDLFSETNPYNGYKKVNAEDISCGRFRPLGHYYMAASYFLNALRCGIPFVLGCQIPMQGLVNAELLGHTQFQIVFAGMVVGLASWLVLSQSGSLLAAFCVVLFGSSALSLGENLYKYYADGQEILLVLTGITYIFFFLRGLLVVEEGKSWASSFWVGCLFAIMMSASKETAVAIAGVVVIFCLTDLGLGWWRNPSGFAFKPRSRYLAAHVVLMVCTQTWLLINIPPASGRYTEKYCLRSVSDLWDRFQRIILMLADNPGTGSYLAVMVVLCLIALIMLWIRPSHMNGQARNSLRLALLSGGAGIGSVLIYLPWEFVIRKYLYCAEIFLVICACSLVGALLAFLRLMGMNGIRMALIGAGLMVVPLCNVLTALNWNDSFFAARYDNRHLLATACQMLKSEVYPRHEEGGPALVAVFDSLPPLGHAEITGQEQLHLARFLNKACGLNILTHGRFQFASRSDYSNIVLVPYPYAPMVELHLLGKWRDSRWTNVLLIDSGHETTIDFASIRKAMESNTVYEVVARKAVRLSQADHVEGEIVMYRRRTNIDDIL